MTLTIHEAARAGNLHALRQALQRGVAVEAVEERSGHTPLMAAVAHEDASLAAVELLLQHGADANGVAEPQEWGGLPLSVLAVAVKEAPVDVLAALIADGADVKYCSTNGYTLLTLAATRRNPDALHYLVKAGAPLDGVSMYGESALSNLSHRGAFAEVASLLEAGADPAPLRWSDLHSAVVFGTLADVERCAEEGANLEERDGWARTPFLLAVHAGRSEIAAWLLEQGADREATGRCQKPVMSYPVDNDDAGMLRWLLDAGFDPDAQDEFQTTPLMEAAAEDSVACFRLLVDVGANLMAKDHVGERLIERASDPDIIELLIEQGANPAQLHTEALRDYIGLGTRERLGCTSEEFEAGRARSFGTRNPEPMQVPFWDAMVRCGWSGYRAAEHFGADTSSSEATWSHERFGMSLTALPDGRWVQIAGEHEDSYDPDFCIYNDVIVHDGDGGFQIYGYPKHVFPPTDFHTATLVGRWIYVIGSLGYIGQRGTTTPVYRFDIETFAVEQVETSGLDPGWISRHTAILDGDRIVVGGGDLFQPDESDAYGDLVPMDSSFALDLTTHRWSGGAGPAAS